MKLNTQGKKPEEIGTSDFTPPKPGRYHVAVKTVDDTFEKQPQNVVVLFEVLNGTVPGQAGTSFSEYFFIERENPQDWQIARLTRFAWACGLIGENEEKEVDFQAAAGCQLVVEVYEDEWRDKDGNEKKKIKITKKGGGMWPLGHKEVNDVPIDKDAAEIVTQGAPASQKATEAKAAEAESEDLYGDL